MLPLEAAMEKLEPWMIRGRRVKEAGPSTPVEILGLK